jgi:hypothetical protein
MGKYVSVSSCLEDDDLVRINHHGRRRTDYGTDLPETVHVHFGNVTLWGPPPLVARTLDAALTQVQAIIDAREGEEEKSV